MKKRLVAMLLVLVMAVCAFPVCAFAAAGYNSVEFTGSSGTYYYVSYSNTATWVGWRYKTDGKPVSMVQAYLYMDGQLSSRNDIDSYFGNVTETAIRGYQYNHGMSQDGVVGTNTWRDMAYNSYGTSISYLL